MEGKYTKEGIYYEVGKFKKDRPSLVFVHGLSGSISSWAQFKKMAEKYNTLFFDLRGHGESVHYPNYDDYALQNFAADLRDLTAELKVKEFILISHSYGCLLALDFLGRFQGQVKAAVFLSPDYRIGKTIRGRLTQMLLAGAQLLKYFPFKFTPGGHVDYSIFPKGDWSLKRVLADARNTTFRSYLFCLKQASAFDEEATLPKISMPVLIMHGAKDTIFPVQDSIRMASRIKTARLKILPDANHLLILNNAPQVIDEIEKFILELPK
jgi:pimeloyl-ACP methyl ester carboxylesterase